MMALSTTVALLGLHFVTAKVAAAAAAVAAAAAAAAAAAPCFLRA